MLVVLDRKISVFLINNLILCNQKLPEELFFKVIGGYDGKIVGG